MSMRWLLSFYKNDAVNQTVDGKTYVYVPV